MEITFFGMGSFWDPEENKILCTFQGGFFKTDDLRTIKILSEVHKLKYEGQLPDFNAVQVHAKKPDEITKWETMNINELRKNAKLLKVDGGHNMTKIELIASIKEVIRIQEGGEPEKTKEGDDEIDETDKDETKEGGEEE